MHERTTIFFANFHRTFVELERSKISTFFCQSISDKTLSKQYFRRETKNMLHPIKIISVRMLHAYSRAVVQAYMTPNSVDGKFRNLKN